MGLLRTIVVAPQKQGVRYFTKKPPEWELFQVNYNPDYLQNLKQDLNLK